MVRIKNAKELDMMRAAGKLGAETLQYALSLVEPGATTGEIDRKVEKFIRSHGAIPAPLNYKGFPKSICTSINEVVCHGIPGNRKLKEGDIIGVDVTVILDGFHGDTASTVPVGEVAPSARRLMDVTLEAQRRGIGAVRPGARLGDVGHAIQAYAEAHGFSVVRDFVGHGIGRGFHEDPQVKHYGEPGKGLRITEGLCFTIEPMINEGTYDVRVLSDGWTAVTADGKLSAQYEHTVACVGGGFEILTMPPEGAKFVLRAA